MEEDRLVLAVSEGAAAGLGGAGKVEERRVGVEGGGGGDNVVLVWPLGRTGGKSGRGR